MITIKKKKKLEKINFNQFVFKCTQFVKYNCTIENTIVFSLKTYPKQKTRKL